MERRNILRLIVIAYLIITALVFSFSILSLYPHYLLFVPKFSFENRYYKIHACSFITSFIIGQKDITAYYKVFTCEENHVGNWELEHFSGFSVLTNNETHFIVKSLSNILTQNITKIWTFLKSESYFFVNITKVYNLTSWNMNNQIIIDLNNSGFQWSQNCFTFLGHGFNISFTIIQSDPFTSFQWNNKTELQINFNNQSDRDLRHHIEGERETVLIIVKVDD